MINKIWSTKIKEYASSEKNVENYYLNLKKLNLIIGANNTGKSRILRTLFSADHESLSISMIPESEVRSNIASVLDFVNIDKDLPQIKGVNFINVFDGNLDSVPAIQRNKSSIKKIASDLASGTYYTGGAESHNYGRFVSHVGHAKEKYINYLSELANGISIPDRYYIPILRGLRPLNDSVDLYGVRTIKDYFGKLSNIDPTIITGFNLYKLLSQFLLGQPKERKKIREYEKIMGNEFFGGLDITLIPEYQKDTISVKIGDEEQFPIYDLGDGLQQIIIITSAAFLNDKSSIYFIEEPENSLHPGLLRKLATFLLNHTPHQYLVTTHSNHLLDLAEMRDDVLIQRVSKDVSQPTPFFIRECSKDRDILVDLGVHPSSVYLANATIWVEGITDRFYIQEYMRKYLISLPEGEKSNKYKGYMENYHYAFVEYQGGNLGHWNFDNSSTGLSATKVCASIFLIADGDIKNKQSRFEALKKNLEDNFYLLPGKEIENTLPEQVVKHVAQALFDSKRKGKDGLDKSKIMNLDYNSYKCSDRGIGYHLDILLGLDGMGASGRLFFADTSGTINDKTKFCSMSIDAMRREEWEMTDEIKNLCEKIFSHIEKNN